MALRDGTEREADGSIRLEDDRLLTLQGFEDKYPDRFCARTKEMLCKPVKNQTRD